MDVCRITLFFFFFFPTIFLYNSDIASGMNKPPHENTELLKSKIGDKTIVLELTRDSTFSYLTKILEEKNSHRFFNIYEAARADFYERVGKEVLQKTAPKETDKPTFQGLFDKFEKVIVGRTNDLHAEIKKLRRNNHVCALYYDPKSDTWTICFKKKKGEEST